MGTIIVTFTDEQLKAAMADDRIDYIIPFHRSQWKKKQYGAMGLPAKTKDYTYQQNEKLIQKTYEGTGLTPDEIWEEAVCDSLGDMNIFAATASEQDAHEMLTETKKAATETETEKTRGPPAIGKTSIETWPDGKKYVRADRQVIFGNDPDSWSEQLEDYINGKIRRGENVTLIAADGDILTLTADTAGKVASPYRGAVRMSDAEFERKVNAGSHIDELAAVSTRGTRTVVDENARHGDQASGGWNYRTAYFLDFDNTYYECKISVSIGKNGNAVYNIGDMRKRSIPSFSGSSTNSGARAGVASSNEKSSPTVPKALTGSSANSGAQRGKASREVNVAQETEKVKEKISRDLNAVDISYDAATDSVHPGGKYSRETWGQSQYVTERNKAAKELAASLNISQKKAKAYIDSVNSIAKMIADDQTRLDYEASPGRSSFVSNAEYGGSFDFSTLCKKRRLLTGTFTAIQKALPNTALTADEILEIRSMMAEKGLEVSCGLCYVEGSRANMGGFTQSFIELYKKYNPGKWYPDMAEMNTPDGIEWVRINHPEVYEQYEYFWNHYGTLKDGDPKLFASQQKPKLYQLHTAYQDEILQNFKNGDAVTKKNENGGIRLQSFSDFEIVHLIDTMQVIMDMANVGLAGQAYTKMPDFAWALGDTGLKINLSLIAKGVDADGKLIFDNREGMNIDDAMDLSNTNTPNC